MRKIAVLPALLTLGNGVSGFAAIAFASKIGTAEFPAAESQYLFGYAGWFIMLGMVFDMLDGHVARISRTASKFGGELDSLCDAITFGVAPAFLLLKMGPGWAPRELLHELLAGIAAIYMSCAVLRLARFNVDNGPDPGSHKRFKGLPSPGAAGCIATLAIFLGEFPNKLAKTYMPGMEREVLAQTVYFVQKGVEIIAPLVALLVALLMVSGIPFPHVSNQILKGRRPRAHLVQVLLAGFIILVIHEVALLAIFLGYALGVPIWVLIARKYRAQTADVQVHPQGQS